MNGAWCRKYLVERRHCRCFTAKNHWLRKIFQAMLSNGRPSKRLSRELWDAIRGNSEFICPFWHHGVSTLDYSWRFLYCSCNKLQQISNTNGFSTVFPHLFDQKQGIWGKDRKQFRPRLFLHTLGVEITCRSAASYSKIHSGTSSMILKDWKI